MTGKIPGLHSLFVLLIILLTGVATGCSSAGEEQVEEAEAVGRSEQAVCSSVTLVPNFPSYTATPGQAVTWTAQGSCTSTAQYAFNLRSTNGIYTREQDWSASNQWVWTTTGLPAGSYIVEVLVSDVAGTPGTYQSYNSQGFTLSSSSPCTGASTTVSPPNSATVGATVTLTTTASGCSSAEYRIVHRYPNGTYVEASPYSPTNSIWSWDTSQGGAANAPGTHAFEVWVRAPGSTAAYETYTSFSYTLQASSPCTGTTLSVSPPNHAPSGTLVTLSAGATGCTSPTFRYIVKLTTGTWVEIQPWTSSATASWNTSLLPAGSYYFQVWTRSADSTADYESYVGQDYTLDPASVTTSPQALAGGMDTYCLLKAGGAVACWGYNVNKELGNPEVPGNYSVVPVTTGITTGVSLAAGYSHQCALLTGGSINCWGSNFHGQLGNGNTTTPTSPVTVSGIGNAVSIGAGNSHTCAALSDGSLRCWGYNSQGQLGNGVTVASSTPITVPGIAGATKVVAGYYHTCALLSDGTVRCWGFNQGGQLGNGTNTNSLTPVTVTGLTGVTTLSSASGSSCALKTDGTIWCWGSNGQGNLGDGTTTPRSVPVQVSGITTATSVAVNQDHACASLQDGTATCWGYNGYGQLGNGTTTSSLLPVPVSTLTTVTAVAIGDNNSCATLSDGTAACWGYNGQGGLGNGTTVDTSTPVAIGTLP